MEENERIDDFLEALQQYITRQLESVGQLVVEERNGGTRSLGKHLDLEFVNVQACDAIACENSTYFAPVLVLAVDQEEKPVIYELEFYMNHDQEDQTWKPRRICLQTRDQEDEASPIKNTPVYLWNSERENGREHNNGSSEFGKNGGTQDASSSMKQNNQNERIKDEPEEELRLLIPIH